ncbi:MAG: methylmalonyl-CoA mutase family protein [Anaerolineales bacterium]|nr:methylmalonyl-CoA mutase family protein [Anaerolineales bacterium]
MPDRQKLEELQKTIQRWEKETLQASLDRTPERQSQFMTTSSELVNRLYTPADLGSQNYDENIGYPGQYPFTRGVHPSMYRSRQWTMRMFAGFGAAEETNQRFKYLLEQGQTGLSTAFDMPTLMGFDTDAPEAEGEFGRCGVAISSLLDMEILLDGLPLDKISTSMTINSPAAVIWAMYIAAAEKRGIQKNQLRGTLQNDILKEYIAQKEYIFPPEPSMRLVTDTIAFGSAEVPLWNTISISGYHIREAGATAVQELAFTLADGVEYVRWALERGLPIDDFAPRLSFFFNAHNDFFEEIAKYRAARRIWAREMRDTYKAKNPRSWLMRFHSQTAGVSLTAEQPEINIVRVAIQALAAVMGGTQSLHTNSMDEALALPSEHAATIALRTQQIIAEESGVVNSVDPLGGSYFLEALTDKMERQVYDYFDRIEALGGVLPAIERGFFQGEISDSAYRYQREIEQHLRKVIGVNAHKDKKDPEIPILKMDPEGYKKQIGRINQLKKERDPGRVGQTLDGLRIACLGTENTMPYLLEAVHAYATLGEIIEVMKGVFGTYREENWI